ncbi:MAG: AraC family transcriptional regulator [Christensenellaceae bacterium]|jgi:phosphoribosylamine-glycine ligase|nr:AraC family transcriptional regulator [Christensenellaceae bacterium]
MTVRELIGQSGARLLNEGVDLEGEVLYGYACDLLSWVMARAAAKTAWITVMTHLNVVAVAALLDMACVIVPENAEIAQDVLDKAKEEGIPVLGSGLTAFELAGRLYEAGLKRPEKG